MFKVFANLLLKMSKFPLYTLGKEIVREVPGILLNFSRGKSILLSYSLLNVQYNSFEW